MKTVPQLMHWVLVGPKGRQAGRRDQRKIANQIAAIQITESGRGGGIISALLPRTTQESDRIEKLIRRGYTTRSVLVRKNRSKVIREAVMDDALIVKLAIYFENEKGHSPRAMKAVIREFSNWVCSKLKGTNLNNVRKLIEARYPDLADRTSPHWWRTQLSVRAKKIKK